jgi:hypothetical protein
MCVKSVQHPSCGLANLRPFVGQARTSGGIWRGPERGSEIVRSWVVPLLGVIRHGCSDDAHENQIDAGAGSRPLVPKGVFV